MTHCSTLFAALGGTSAIYASIVWMDVSISALERSGIRWPLRMGVSRIHSPFRTVSDGQPASARSKVCIDEMNVTKFNWVGFWDAARGQRMLGLF